MSPLEVGLTLHRAGELDRAATVYQNVLTTDPKLHQAAYLLGVIKLQRQEWEQAATLLKAAVATNPCRADYHVALGVALRNLGDLAGALISYKEAIRLDPTSADAHNNLGALDEVSGNPDAAQECYITALRLRPDLPDAHYNLGNILRRKEELANAADCYRKALAVNPKHKKAAVNLAIVLSRLGHFADAEEVLWQAISQISKSARLVSLLGQIMIARDNWNGAAELLTDFFARSSRRRYQNGAIPPAIRHDCEQIRYIAQCSHDAPGIKGALTEVTRLFSASRNDAINLDDHSTMQRLSTVLADTFHIQECGALDSSPLNANMSVQGKEYDILSGHASHLVIDGLLTNQALLKLRDFCLKSTIWSASTCSSELIANMESGFSCPLLFQIATDLKRNLPILLGREHLIMAWAYRYIGDTPEFGPHGDPGLFTVNFWITPDEANLDPDLGGLRVWDMKTPPYYIGQPRSAQLEIVRELLNNTTRDPIVVPYRCNRAVIFQSATIHSTDQFRFSTGFAERRMNVTLLFGDGTSKDAP